LPKVSCRPSNDSSAKPKVKAPTIPAAPRIPCPGLRCWNSADTATSEPRTKFGTVVVAVARMFVPNCSEAIVTKIAQENGLSSDVVSLSQNFPYILQSGTDAAMLDEITLRTGTEWLVDDEKLILRKPSSASPIATVKLGEDLVKFKARFSAAGHIDEVKVLGWDPKQKQPITSVDANTATNPTGASSPGQVGTMRSSTTSLKVRWSVRVNECVLPPNSFKHLRTSICGQRHTTAISAIS